MIAAVMSGGLATRMKGSVEKPLLTVGGVPIIARVIDALADSKSFERVVVAVSPNNPATKQFLEIRGIETIKTSGKGYSMDLSFLLGQLGSEKVLVISADLPLINAKVISEIASATQSKPLLSVVLTKKFVESVGITPSITFRDNGVDYCQSGISKINTAEYSAGLLDEEYIVMDRIELAVNVNTKEELEVAEKLLVQRAQDLAQN